MTSELVGAEAVGGADVAAALTRTTGRPVAYRPVPLAEARETVAATGAVPFQVPMLLSTYSAIAHGFLDGRQVENDLPALLGRAPRPALDVIAGGTDAAW
ncbi:hypothetical protein ACFVHB_31905 [Kitasatospora sp. NPDC127111]|uniref:hypothetical protein n=1 Tax=Kitasatospora sp. NPDC127111 TaxID=3345363 RepID=UPI00363E4827